jgi:glutathione S-transferase
MRGHRWADDQATIEGMKKAVPRTVTACFELIEHKMLAGPWVMGEAYTICDPYLFTVAQWLEVDGVDLGAVPSVVDHRRRMTERPAVQRALEAERA